MAQYKVVPAGPGWKIRVGDRTIGPFDTKEAAESHATMLRQRDERAAAAASRQRQQRKG